MTNLSMLLTRRMSKQVLLPLPMLMLILRNMSITSLLTKNSWTSRNRCLHNVVPTENLMRRAKLCSETLKPPRIMPLLLAFLSTAAILDVALERVIVLPHTNGHKQSTTALQPPQEHLQEGERLILQEPHSTQQATL